MKTVIIVQARMTSIRLPGKVLKTVLDKPLLEYQIERLRRVKLADEIVIATTTNRTDQPIVDLCERLSVPYFRGSEEDVLARYYGAAKVNQADIIVRVTADCPVIDPQAIDQVIQFYLDNKSKYDYVSNFLNRTYPRGMECEVIPFRVLDEVFLKATRYSDREHVTPFIYKRPERYSLGNVAYLDNLSYHRWTVDTPEDFELIKRIIEGLYPSKADFTLTDILDLFAQHPSWIAINAHIEQKSVDNSRR